MLVLHVAVVGAFSLDNTHTLSTQLLTHMRYPDKPMSGGGDGGGTPGFSGTTVFGGASRRVDGEWAHDDGDGRRRRSRSLSLALTQ